jgi:hypothetical protein
MTTPVSACSQSDPGSGVDEAHGDLLPDEKIERICKLLVEHKQVGMLQSRCA